MADLRPRLYEGLFLLDQRAASADYSECVQHLQKIFEHAEVEVLVLKKWGEHRLAYEIKGQKRGTYLLAYFNAEGAKIATIERDCNLSEKILRHMVLQADHIGETELELAKQDDGTEIESSLRDGSNDDREPGLVEAKVEVESQASGDPAHAGA